MNDFSDDELIKVISDFLEQGLAENIVAMFRKEPELHRLTGELLKDERFMVRMGIAVLYEELAVIRPDDVGRAIPSLKPLLTNKTDYIRGEACNLLGIINTPESLTLLKRMRTDPDPQVREIVDDFLGPS
ncbi:MAG: HEAT repeat domain-containing protein [Proteobacteria bacterium]|nr:HEAT repeat domain-containing protein [Pseudomonadota bacterium]MBU1739315.1 HEAT repeat domain-containing protein [Pseudomonadota bacterium]